MAPQKHVAATTAIRSWAGADGALAEVRELEGEIARLERNKQFEFAQIGEQHDARILPTLQRRDVLAKALEEFATMNRGDLGTAKSKQLNAGTLGFRLGQPSLKTMAKLTWEKVLEILQVNKMKKFIRVKTEVDKQALLASGLDAESLKGFGVRIVQEERFFYDFGEVATQNLSATSALGAAVEQRRSA